MNRETMLERIKDIISIMVNFVCLTFLIMMTVWFAVGIIKQLKTVNNYNIEHAVFVNSEMITTQEPTAAVD